MRTCKRCGAPAGRKHQYCEPCGIARRRETHIASVAKNLEKIRERERGRYRVWSQRTRGRMPYLPPEFDDRLGGVCEVCGVPILRQRRHCAACAAALTENYDAGASLG